MFGALRLFLAAVVVVFHAGYVPYGVRMGVSAVVVFYVLSGYAMSGLFSTRFGSPANAGWFYLERFVRIAPQFYFYLALTLLGPFGLGMWSAHFPERQISAVNLLGNASLLPLGLTAYLPPLDIFAIVGPTVTLANEFLFYLLTPVILVVPAATLAGLALSVTVFVLATHGVVPMANYSYNYLPGPLVFFLAGQFIHQRKYALLGATLTALAMNYGLLGMSGLAGAGFNIELHLGLFCGVAAIMALGRLRNAPLDAWLGLPSYGCFLGHSVILVAMRHYDAFPDSKAAFAIALLAASILLGYMSYFLVERPTVALRRACRKIRP